MINYLVDPYELKFRFTFKVKKFLKINILKKSQKEFFTAEGSNEVNSFINFLRFHPVAASIAFILGDLLPLR